MKNIFFLNHVFKTTGAIFLAISVALGIYMMTSVGSSVFGIFVPEKFVAVLTLLSLMSIVFSKEKNESTQINEIKKDALFLALLINLVCSILLIVSLSSINNLWVYFGSMFSVYLFYIVIFYVKKASLKKATVTA